MRIGLLLVTFLALLPGRADAQTAVASPVLIEQVGPTERDEACPFAPGRIWRVLDWGMTCGWTNPEPSASTLRPDWLRPDWGYKAGATLFVAGNMITFSFPIWAALGADVVAVTGVIITGEIVEVVGIYLMGEEAFHQVRGRLGGVMNQLRDRFDRWRSTHLPDWS
jgi:hypothetical protein